MRERRLVHAGLILSLATAVVAQPSPSAPAPEAPAPVPAAACECATPLTARFAHELRDGRHVTTTGIVVPASHDETGRVLEDVPAYPTWLFTGPGGAPTLHDLRWDRATGAFSLLVGAGGKGLPLAGTLTVTRGAGGTSVRASGSDDDVKEWSFELTARPDASCPARSVLTLRMELLFSLKARVFGGSAKSMPLLLALAARDDLAARFVTTPARMQCVGLKVVSSAPSGRPVVALDGGAPAEVLACRPRALAVGAQRAQAFGAHLAAFQSGKKGDIGDLLDAMVEAISGEHPISSWHLDVRGRDDRVVLGDAPASVHAGATVQPEKEGFSLAFGAGASR